MKKNLAPIIKLIIILSITCLLFNGSGVNEIIEVEEFEGGGINLEKTLNVIDEGLISSESLVLGIFRNSRFANEIIICFEEEGQSYVMKEENKQEMNATHNILFEGQKEESTLTNGSCFSVDRRIGMLNYNVTSSLPIIIKPKELTERIYINETHYYLGSSTMEYFFPAIKITAKLGNFFKIIWFLHLFFISGLFVWAFYGLCKFIGKK